MIIEIIEDYATQQQIGDWHNRWKTCSQPTHLYGMMFRVLNTAQMEAQEGSHNLIRLWSFVLRWPILAIHL